MKIGRKRKKDASIIASSDAGTGLGAAPQGKVDYHDGIFCYDAD